MCIFVKKESMVILDCSGIAPSVYITEPFTKKDGIEHKKSVSKSSDGLVQVFFMTELTTPKSIRRFFKEK